MSIEIAETDAEILACYPVMAELRPHVARELFVERIRRQIESQNFRLAYVVAEVVPAVAGFRVGENLAWGNFLYVDDLVTAGAERSKGHGEALMGWLVRHAAERGCDQLHLDSGVQRFAAHRFYLRHRMEIASHHFSIKI